MNLYVVLASFPSGWLPRDVFLLKENFLFFSEHRQFDICGLVKHSFLQGDCICWTLKPHVAKSREYKLKGKLSKFGLVNKVAHFVRK